MKDRRGAHVELARLPDEVAELIAGLAPGGSVVITRDGEPVATLTAAGSAPLEGTVIRARADSDSDSASASGSGSGSASGSGSGPTSGPTSGSAPGDGVMVVATSMKLSDSARTKLSSELGAEYIVLDMHDAPSTADVLLVPPISPQLLGSLREMFPQARVVVAELEDPELGISYRGPVRRLIDSGAELYLASTTVPHLARQLGEAVSARWELGAGPGRRSPLELE
jgi:antitoxin (DNA-binding transcriptional repressor) of toxin-antitoxin stability system